MILLELIRERVLGQAPKRSIPTMDGAWRPNDLLETCARLPLQVAQPSALACGPDQTLFLASGKQLLSSRAPDYTSVANVAEFDGSIRGLAWHPSVGLVAAVTGTGLVVGIEKEAGRSLDQSDTGTLRHPTSLTIAKDGTIYVTEGSTRFGGEDWVKDLMAKRADGRLLRYAQDEAKGKTLASGLAFPTAVGLDPAETPVVAEAWRHRLLRFSGGSPQILLDNLPGYPGGLMADNDGWWLSLFAPRSHIVEFVLEEDKFRNKMMEQIDPAFWISPSTDPREHHFQPVQVGALRTQNIKKPWAPARSFGLVAHLDSDFTPQYSYHSRSNGSRHGTSAMTIASDVLLVASQGANAILLPQVKQE